MRIRKVMCLALISSVVGSAYAVAPGFYLGGMVGPATNNASSVNAKTISGTPVMTPVTPKAQQWGSRFFLGYKINEYAGTELGFTFFSSIEYDNKGISTCSGTNARVRDVDFVGKFSYPLGQFDVYGKIGPAAVYTTTSGGLNSGPNDCGRSQYNSQIRPTYSFGGSWDMNQNWVADASLNTVMAGGSVSSMTFFALGISYHFVDKFCGQFLCDD